MGAPSAPTIVQQTTAPSADEKQAAIDAQRQKSAALMKINQDVFARSQGLRGAASMYDMAGPTPWLAGAHVGGWPGPPAAGKPAPPGQPPGSGYNPSGPFETRGPKDSRENPTGPQLPGTARGSPANTGSVPGARNIPTSGVIGRGAPANTGAVPTGPPGTALSPFGPQASMFLQETNANLKAAGLPAAMLPTTPAKTMVDPSSLLLQNVNKQLAAQGRPAETSGSAIPKTAYNYANPAAGAQVGWTSSPAAKINQIITAKGGTAQPVTPVPALPAIWGGGTVAQAGQVAPTPTAPAPAQPAASTPAPKAPASSSAAPPQPLAQPATTATTKPTTAPAPATTLGGVAKPVVYANPNLKTVAPLPKAGLMAGLMAVGRGKSF